ncbi:MAG: hypothetical protein ABJC98_15830 [Bacteroidota bacterium]
MKDLVKKAVSFITFSTPLQSGLISIQFASIHNRYEKRFSKWSTTSTRQKLIATFWLSHVLKHFLFLFILSDLFVFVANRQAISFLLPGTLLGSLLVMPVLLLFHYVPSYSYDFLPNLEMVKESFEESQNDKMEKCRQAQLSNFALALVFYVIDKTSAINTLQCTDRSAALLMKLYGVDNGSMKKNLELILGKKRQLSPRKYTEIQNRFDEACAFFEDLQFTKGIQILRELEAKFQP